MQNTFPADQIFKYLHELGNPMNTCAVKNLRGIKAFPGNLERGCRSSSVASRTD